MGLDQQGHRRQNGQGGTDSAATHNMQRLRERERGRESKWQRIRVLQAERKQRGLLDWPAGDREGPQQLLPDGAAGKEVRRIPAEIAVLCNTKSMIEKSGRECQRSAAEVGHRANIDAHQNTELWQNAARHQCARNAKEGTGRALNQAK